MKDECEKGFSHQLMYIGMYSSFPAWGIHTVVWLML